MPKNQRDFLMKRLDALAYQPKNKIKSGIIKKHSTPIKNIKSNIDASKETGEKYS